MTDSNSPRNFTIWAINFELGLGVVAGGLGWITGVWPWETMTGPRTLHALGAHALAGVLLAVLLFAGIVVSDRHPCWFFRDLQQTVRRLVVPLFRHVSGLGLLAISVSAGIGEELLFRGFGQAALQLSAARVSIPPPWAAASALLAASIVFGLCHWVSWAYALLATLMGLLLGALWLATGDLLAPIVAHGLYDFLALLYLTRPRAPEVTASPDASAEDQAED